jgi:DNA-binding transcriptional ArsR family regulator
MGSSVIYALTRIFSLGYTRDMLTTPLSAIAEPNRMRIVELLRDGPRPVGEIARRLRLRQPQVSKHLRILTDAGLVRVRPLAQQRVYQLQAKPFRDLGSWLETFRRLWGSRLDTLDEYLQDMKGEPKRG